MTIFCFLKLAFIKILSASPNGDYRLTLTVALPDGIFYAEDSTLYWMVRSINDTGISIDENALIGIHVRHILLTSKASADIRL